MIARLTGTLAETSADGAVIDVGGVGYQVLASTRTLDALEEDDDVQTVSGNFLVPDDELEKLA